MKIFYVVIGVLAGLTLGFGGGYLKGKSVGRQEVLTQGLKDRVITLEEGKKIDEKISNADDSALCSILGGC